MAKQRFRVKPYKNAKYKFVVRGKISGKWSRRYFISESEAVAFAEQQNGALGEGPVRERPERDRASAGAQQSPSLELADVTSPAYRGPRIQRYLGDSWCMHLPFAYDLMRVFAPKVFVELGVKQGESYFTFCQSAAENQIDVRCYGIDAWKGDVQTGMLDPEIQSEVAQYNWRYSSFSELRPVLFEQALAEFPDGSIDLLHIDGTHTYDAVKADFQSWLPKLSSKSIVLFHDVILRDRGFGVWKLWEEIRGEDRSFVFEFGYGLGVWKKEVVTTEDAPFIQKLFRATETEKRDINNFYVTAATALALWQDSQKLQVFDEKVGHVGLLRRETGQRADLPLDVERELAESSKHVAAPQREDEERTRQVREKESELVDLRHEHETQNSSIAELNRTIADQSRKVADLQQRIETNLAEADQLRGEITKQRARHERDNLRRSRLAQQLRARLQEAEERAARARADLSNAEWEVLSLRGSSIRDAESANSLSRIQEIESRAEVAESDRAHLREMVVALQQDLAQERVSRDAAQNDLRTAQDKLAVAHKDLAAARKELRRQQNPLDWVRRAFGGKLVLQFGRSQQRLKELTTATPSDD